MSKDYTVDDILADVVSKKGNNNKRQAEQKQAKDFSQKTVMFNAGEVKERLENPQRTNASNSASDLEKTTYFNAQKVGSPYGAYPKREKNFTKRDIMKGFGEKQRLYYDGEEEEVSSKKPKIENSFNFSRTGFSEGATGNGNMGERSFSFDDENEVQEETKRTFQSPNATFKRENSTLKTAPATSKIESKDDGPSYLNNVDDFKLNIDKKLFMDLENEIEEISKEASEEEECSSADLKTEEKSLPQEDDLPKDEVKKTADNYRSPMDEEQVADEISKIHKGVVIRNWITAVLFGLSVYFTVAYKNTAPLPDFILPTGDTMKAFIIFNAVICLIAMLVNSRTVWSGILGFFTFRGDSDTLISFASLACTLQGAVFAGAPDRFYSTHLDLFFPVGILLLLFNGIGKQLLIGRIKNNFAVISSKGKKFALMSVRSQSMRNTIDKIIGSPRDKIVYYCRARWLSGFTTLSYTEDPSDDLCRLISPICIIGAGVISVATYFLTQSAFDAFTAFAVILSLAAPITSTIATNLPLYKMAKEVNKDEAIITGYEAVNEFSKTDTVIVNAPDMFKPEGVILHGIKPFDKTQLEEVITDAASVLTSCHGTLSEVFLQLINGDRSVLKKVDDVKYFDSCGLSAIVDGKEVLIGNRRLMIKNGIEVPSAEYEKKYVKDARNIVYLSNSGKLSSMFIISYHPDEEFLKKLKAVIEEGIDLVVYTTDPNITAEMVADTLQVPRDYVTVMPSKIHGIYQKNTKARSEIPAKIGFVGGIDGMLHTITASIRVKSSISRGIGFQLAFLVIGYLLGTFFAFMGKLSLLNFMYVIGFHAVSLVLGAIAVKYKE